MVRRRLADWRAASENTETAYSDEKFIASSVKTYEPQRSRRSHETGKVFLREFRNFFAISAAKGFFQGALLRTASFTMFLVPETKPFRLTESVKAAG